MLAFAYQKILRPVLFRFDAEQVHKAVVTLGEGLGRLPLPLAERPKELASQVAGIKFSSPIGLAAGFDYEARLTQVLPLLGFGFETVGTITYPPSAGNPKPQLGRLPRSKSLMVNKGFRNLGARATAARLAPLKFSIPVGVSLGSRQASVAGIVKAFETFENSKSRHSYYELNMSCPNLQTRRDFYSPKNLTELLIAVDHLRIQRPIFVKMPISKTDQEVLRLLDTICSHCPAGVIFGNLQKDRQDPVLVKSEVTKFSVGNFSGLPTKERSNQLIRLAYRHFHNRLIIIGCGGVFNASDAYEKICLGATLVQLITGLVFQGPQLVWQINCGLTDLLRRDGFKNISEAIGSRH